MTAEMVMWISGLAMVIAVTIAFWNLEKCHDRTAHVWLAVALIALALFVLADIRAEMRHELKHAVEHRAVQESVQSIREF